MSRLPVAEPCRQLEAGLNVLIRQLKHTTARHFWRAVAGSLKEEG